MQASKFTVKTLSKLSSKPAPPLKSSQSEAGGRLRELTKELRELEEKLRLGGAQKKSRSNTSRGNSPRVNGSICCSTKIRTSRKLDYS